MKKHWVRMLVVAVLGCSGWSFGCDADGVEVFVRILNEDPGGPDTWETDVDTEYSCQDAEGEMMAEAFDGCGSEITLCFDDDGYLVNSAASSDVDEQCFAAGERIILDNIFPCHAGECVAVESDSPDDNDMNADDDCRNDPDDPCVPILI